MILWDKLEPELELFEIKQRLVGNEQRKLAETLENYSGSWRLFYEDGLNIKHNPLLQNLFFVFVGPSLNT